LSEHKTLSVSWSHYPYSESEWLSCMIIQTNTRTRQLQLYHNSEDFYPSPLTRG
ncbi:hypothetical protein AB7O22_20125, partial [Escherichia coli]